MLLPAAYEGPFQNMIGIRQGRSNVATLDTTCRTNELLPGNCVFDTEDCGQLIQLDAHGCLGGLQGLLARASQEDNGLANVVAGIFRQELFVVEDRTEGIRSGHVRESV